MARLIHTNKKTRNGERVIEKKIWQCGKERSAKCTKEFGSIRRDYEKYFWRL